MALTSRFLSNDFAPVFRFIDDYAKHILADRDRDRAGLSPLGMLSESAADFMQSFRPRFDMVETKDIYELHGDLPGIEQEDIVMEFTDPHTLAIKGSCETVREEGERGEEREGGGKVRAQPENPKQRNEGVDGDAVSKGQVATAKQTPIDGNGSITTATPKRWLSERSYGSFARFFTFPERVKQDEVKASLRNGVLTVKVPKAPAYEGRKIQIE